MQYGPALSKDEQYATSLYYEPHSTEVVFGRRRRRTFFTQIIGQISGITFELVKSIVSSVKGWTFIMKGQSNSFLFV
ncbi:hypothetical protein EVAR_92422_1 [Eumeta japonica]|uniref:Uncharacterized protein n=1 Tax=Eumeta variegata TaxID=151549 RepID=A0A4C1T8Q2_EUMVA|nr:hypothetical protein EVAR_92422_1 [Eumeta japonica]